MYHCTLTPSPQLKTSVWSFKGYKITQCYQYFHRTAIICTVSHGCSIFEVFEITGLFRHFCETFSVIERRTAPKFQIQNYHFPNFSKSSSSKISLVHARSAQVLQCDNITTLSNYFTQTRIIPLQIAKSTNSYFTYAVSERTPFLKHIAQQFRNLRIPAEKIEFNLKLK